MLKTIRTSVSAFCLVMVGFLLPSESLLSNALELAFVIMEEREGYESFARVTGREPISFGDWAEKWSKISPRSPLRLSRREDRRWNDPGPKAVS